jgi:trk system potassium uptake protein TrkA
MTGQPHPSGPREVRAAQEAERQPARPSARLTVVIMGSGRTGAALANRLAADGHRVSIVDVNPDAFERYLDASFAGRTVLGNGIDEDVLREAGIERADGFVACAGGDNENLMAAQTAKVTFGVKRVVCRCNDAVRAEIFGQLGLVIASPSQLAARALRHALLSEKEHEHDVAASIDRLLVR